MSEVFVNGDLEIWTGVYPDDWTITESADSYINFEPDVVHGGEGAARMDIDAGNSPVEMYQDVTLVANSRYAFSFWRKHSAPAKTLKIMIRDSASNVWLDEDGSWAASETWISIANTEAMEQFIFNFVTHSDYTAYRVVVSSNSAASSSIYIDDLSLQDVVAPTPVIISGDRKYGWKDNCVNTASVDANGLPDFITAGAGLDVDLAGAMIPIEALINGNYCKLAADENIAGLTANRNNYLWIQKPPGREDITSFGTSIYRPKFGYTFNLAYGVRNERALLHFEGANHSTVFTDEAGMLSWTANGNAEISTVTSKFGSACGLFDGAGDYVSTTGFIRWPEVWMMDCWVRFNALPANLAYDGIFGAINANTLSLRVYGSGGNQYLRLFLGSTGSSFNIANGTQGTTDLATGQWYHIALVFDGSNYIVYLDGIVEITVASSLALYTPGGLWLGRATSYYLSGVMDEFRLSSETRWIDAFTPPTAAYGNHAEDNEYWFDCGRERFKYFNGADWIDEDRIFIGEALCGAATVTSVVNYALGKKYLSGFFAIAASTDYEKTHNIGIPTEFLEYRFLTYEVNPAKAKPGFISGDPFAALGGTTMGCVYKVPTTVHRHVKIKTLVSPLINDADAALATSGYMSILSEGVI